MKFEQKKVNFTDDRGTIMDVFVGRPFEHCVVIHSTKGSVRGNHYHAKSEQADFMIQGRMVAFSRKAESDVIEERVLSAGDWTEWDRSEVHEFIALGDDVIFMSVVNGPRGGDNYENDTFRLPVPLHELKGRKLEDILKS